jgi:uncharacterized protein (DUF2267 family)
MKDIQSILSAKSGLGADLTRRGIMVTLRTLRGRLPAETFSSLTASLPELQETAARQQPGTPDQLDFWTDLHGPARPEKGAGGTPVLTLLLQELSREGFTLEQTRSFLPALIGALRARVDPSLVRAIERGIPGIDNLGARGWSESLLDRLKRIF